MPTYGIDISVHNGTVDWSRASKKVDFVIARAGYGKEISQKDSQFENNYSGCKTHKIPMGAYWYCYAKSVDDARLEAQACVSILGGKSFELPVFYDIEEQSTLALGKSTVSNIAKTFLNIVKSSGVKVGIYSMVSALNNHFTDDILNNYDVWCAHVGVSKPSYYKTYAIWQFSWTGHIDGISGEVDQNYCYKSYSGISTVSSIDVDGSFADNPVALVPSIDYTQLTPYIVTISRKTSKVNFDNLKSLGVVGVMIEAGSYFDSLHIVNKSYRNPKLTEQVQLAVDADLPFAFYHDIRSKSVDEAKKELAELKTCIQRFNPTMGVWLRPLFKNTRSRNKEILEYYNKYLVNLGLKGKIGFYATKKQLEDINWEDICSDWYLWLDEHVGDIREIDRLLNPEFFMTGYESSEPLANIGMLGNMNMINSTVYGNSVFCGDSRTVGLSLSVPDITTVAKGSMGHDWLVSQLNTIKSYTGVNLIFWFGVNDLWEPDKYAETYTQLYNEIGSINNIVLMSVGPCNGSYSNLNSKIEKFNSELYNAMGSKVTWLDAYAYLNSINFTSFDGLHYDSSVYVKLYNWVIQQLSAMQLK